MELRITTLIENNPDDCKQLYYEHGLSLIIETDGKRILFDTGMSGDFISNAKVLNQNLTNLDYILISHGHYDHSGGFKRFVEEVNYVPKLIVGEEFFQPKYKKLSETEYKFNGNAFDEEYISKNRIPLMKVCEDMLYLTEHIIVFHHFKRNNDFEHRNPKFYLREQDSYRADDFLDEISLGIVSTKGLIILVGCSHIGIINIISTIKERVSMPIYGVIGGTHLIEADKNRIHKTIDALKCMQIQVIAVSHCTGEDGLSIISKEFNERFIFNNTGNVIML